jgi:tetratricopeptide (TPR) repeat protein
LIEKQLAELSSQTGRSLERRLEESKLLYFRSLYSDSPEVRERSLARALEITEQALTEAPRNPSALIGYAASHGEAALHANPLKALGYASRLEKVLLTLLEVAPEYEGYAADRGLGILYHAAPAFISVGSNRKAREHFLAALKGNPNHPGNLIGYAEFLFDEGDKEEARRLASRLLSAPELSQYPLQQYQWIEQARAILASTAG